MTPPTPLPGESEKAFRAFTIYLQSAKRSRAKVGKKLGVSRQNIDKWADRFHWSQRVRTAMIADVERGARAAEQAALSVAEENERLKLRHKEQKLRASEKLFAKAHEVLAKSARTSRPPDSVRMFIAAALLGDQVLGTGAQIGLNPQVAPVFRVVFRRDQISDERRRLEDKFFAEHPEIRRPKNGLEDATRLAAD